MKKTLIIITLALVLVAGGGIGAAFYYRGKFKAAMSVNPVMPNIAQNSAAAVPIVDTYVDASGAHHTVVETTLQQLARNRAVDMVNSSLRPIVDSLTAALGIKTKQLEGYAAVSVTARQDNTQLKDRIIDSLKRQTFYYKDRYLSLVFRAGSPSDSLTASSFDFAYDVDLRTVDYMKRRKFLGLAIGRKQYFTDISSSDPRVRVRGVEKFTIPRRVPAFGLRVQALASYNFFTQNYAAGVGLRLDAGDRFNAGINYSYNFGLNTFTPIIYTKYDLVQFGR